MENSKQLIHSFNHTSDTEGNFKGLTKREYFAGLAMQGLIHLDKTDEWITEKSVQMADKLLKKLEPKN